MTKNKAYEDFVENDQAQDIVGDYANGIVGYQLKHSNMTINEAVAHFKDIVERYYNEEYFNPDLEIEPEIDEDE